MSDKTRLRKPFCWAPRVGGGVCGLTETAAVHGTAHWPEGNHAFVPAAEARAGLVGVEALRRDHHPVPYHWSQSGESGRVCAGSLVGLHHRVERWPCDVERAILAALAATPPAPAVERCAFVWGPDSGAECGRLRDDERHTDEGYFLFHPFTPTPEKAP